MKVGVWFWVIWVLALLFGGWWSYRSQLGLGGWAGGPGIGMILTGLLGFGVFGSPIKSQGSPG